MATQLNHLFRTSILKHKTQLEAPFPTTTRTTRFQVINATSSTRSSARQLIESGTVRTIWPKDASTAMNSEGFILLDVRPTWEREKARVVGSLHVPIFVEDIDNSPITLLKKWVHFGYIGLWTGQYLTNVNSEFLSQVENAIPSKDTKLLVACGEGLRSMTAASKLYNGGYRNLGWLGGGFNRSKDNDFPAVEGKEKLQYATVGGVSYYFLQLLILLQVVGKE
ncbi:rhodanese-like domain-containing protein 10 [Gastrolobium bilobum]|uniref:rhodanese-like domain-containing protein 10 n=1 Tax=Gastrolobium bilobum TaxID=150636 RepID=UPI002AB06CDB|nr:rhodanese-like domain-containing protein 10 [Gastrolobium bilobum]